jgi:threonine dehydratase
MQLPTYADILAARARLAGIAHQTPVLTARTANAQCGADIFFKAENFQRTGSFKFRGAVNAIAQLPAETRANGVVAFSSGNHAQAIALAARLADIPACIVMPADAPPAKRAATQNYGAEIIEYDRYTENREAIAHNIAVQRGMSLIPPFDHPAIIAGQGTCAAELFDHTGPLDLLLVCLGGGGLLSGCALAAAARSPACRVIGVEPEAGNDGQQSLRAGHRVRIAVPKSIADGALTTQIGELPFALIQRHVADIVTVPDAALIDAMDFFASRMKIVVEPTGCLAAAAAFTGAVPIAGSRVGIILSGGNVTRV